jgi:hypothetical protein
MTLPMIERWTRAKKGSRMLSLRGAQPRAAQLKAYRRCVAATDRWLARFLDRWLLREEGRAEAAAAGSAAVS